jgi:subtilase family serine protease
LRDFPQAGHFYLVILNEKFRALYSAALLLASLSIQPAMAATSQIHTPIDADDVSILTSMHPPVTLASSIDSGAVDPLKPKRLKLYFRSSVQRKALDSVLEKQVDRGSSTFGKWLTLDEFRNKFGLSTADRQRVTDWLESVGFTQLVWSRDQTSVSFQGTADEIRQVFKTTLHTYRDGSSSHVANRETPSIPRALAQLITGIGGLSDLRPHVKAKAQFTSSFSGSHFLTPADIATLYNLVPVYGAGITGAGITVVVVGQSDIHTQNLTRFWNAAGINQTVPELITSGPDPGFSLTDEQEAEADLEWLGAVAPSAQLIYVASDDVLNSLDYAIDQNLGNIIVVSYGLCEQEVSTITSLNDKLAAAAAQGITVIAASGDFGAAACDAATQVSSASHGLAVDFPASSPYVTGVGGTILQDAGSGFWAATNATYGSSLLTYVPEAAWNDTTSSVIAASGGGISSTFSKPSWQNGSTGSNRSVPDIALVASANHDGYLTCFDGDCTDGFRAADHTVAILGGTSLGAPVAAGIAALVEQKYGPQGVLNGKLYTLASISTDAFHDITTGNNVVPCSVGPSCPSGSIGYQASTGYDNVTGLGTIDAGQLISQWNADFQLSGPNQIAIPSSGGSATIAVTGSGNFDGNVTFTCALTASLQGNSCAINDRVKGSGSVTISISPSHSARVIPAPSTNFFPPVILAFSSVLVIAVLRSPKKRMASVLCSMALLTCGCGAGGASSQASSGSNSGSGTVSNTSISGSVSITASAGTISHVITIPVTIQ